MSVELAHRCETYKLPCGMLASRRPLQEILSERLSPKKLRKIDGFLNHSIPLFNYVEFNPRLLDEPELDTRLARAMNCIVWRNLGKSTEICFPETLLEVRSLKLSPLLAARRMKLLDTAKCALSRSLDTETLVKTYMSFKSLMHIDNVFFSDSYFKALSLMSHLTDEYRHKLINELYSDPRIALPTNEWIRLDHEFIHPGPVKALAVTNDWSSTHMMFLLNTWLLQFGSSPAIISEEGRRNEAKTYPEIY